MVPFAPVRDAGGDQGWRAAGHAPHSRPASREGLRPAARRAEAMVAVISRSGQARGPGGGSQVGEDRVVAGFGGAAGGPEQAVVAVALGLPADPPGEMAQVAAPRRGPARRWRGARGSSKRGDWRPVQAGRPGPGAG